MTAVDMIRKAQVRFPRTRFVFLMGADNFAQLPQWKAWQEIAARVPIAVIARPGDGVKPRLSKTPLKTQSRLIFAENLPSRTT